MRTALRWKEKTNSDTDCMSHHENQRWTPWNYRAPLNQGFCWWNLVVVSWQIQSSFRFKAPVTCFHRLETVALISYTVSTNAKNIKNGDDRKYKTAHSRLCHYPPWIGRDRCWCRSDSEHLAYIISPSSHEWVVRLLKCLLNPPVPAILLKQVMLEEQLHPTY